VQRKKKRLQLCFNCGEIKEGGFLAVEYNDYGKYVNKNSLIKFDENKKKSGDTATIRMAAKNFQILLFRKDENRLYGILRKVNDDDKTFSLLVIDMKTGKELSNQPITGLTPETIYNIDALYSSGKKLIMIKHLMIKSF
jgi:hypothetical protein